MRISFATVIVLSFLPISAIAQTSLKGITKVNVWIDLQDGGGTGSCADTSLAKSFSLTEEDVRTDTELQLRKAGFVVATGEAPARVHVLVTGCQIENASVRVAIMNVYLTLEESATTDRGKRGVVVSWYANGFKVSPRDPRAAIQDYVSKLINQWLADK